MSILPEHREWIARLDDLDIGAVVCHCGAPVDYGFDGDPTHHRGMCPHCDAVRCDAYPGACGL